MPLSNAISCIVKSRNTLKLFFILNKRMKFNWMAALSKVWVSHPPCQTKKAMHLLLLSFFTTVQFCLVFYSHNL